MNQQLTSPPRLEPSPTWLAARREHLVREISESATGPRPTSTSRRVRVSWRLAAVALAVLVLGTGAALAATGFDLLDWIRSDNPSEATFSIDSGRVFSGPAPESISCTEPADAEAFACSAGRRGPWTYILYERVEARPEFTREAALAGLADAERNGVVSAERAEQIRADLKAVDDEFFQRFDLLHTVGMISSPHEVRPGVLLVPPAGIPQFATCNARGDTGFECRNLAASSVPVGAPIYGLVENEEWVERPFVRPGPRDVAALFEALFGRPLTAAEQRLVITLGTAASQPEVESSGGVEAGPTSTGG